MTSQINIDSVYEFAISKCTLSYCSAQVHVSADVHASSAAYRDWDWEEEETQQRREPVVRGQLGRHELKDHYDVYEACKDMRL